MCTKSFYKYEIFSNGVQGILRECKKVVKRYIAAAKVQIRRRRFYIAIDEIPEPFYGKIKNLWIHDYRNGVKGAISKDTDYYVQEAHHQNSDYANKSISYLSAGPLIIGLSIQTRQVLTRRILLNLL